MGGSANGTNGELRQRRPAMSAAVSDEGRKRDEQLDKHDQYAMSSIRVY